MIFKLCSAPGRRRRSITNKLEAMLIHMLETKYNDVKFAIYPNIKNGARSLGYTYSDMARTDFPFA